MAIKTEAAKDTDEIRSLVTGYQIARALAISIPIVIAFVIGRLLRG